MDGELGYFGARMPLFTEISVVCTLLFLSLLLALAAGGPTVCAWAFPGLSDFSPAFLSLLGRHLREKHPPLTGRTWAYSFADAFAAHILPSREDFEYMHGLWVPIIRGNDADS